MQRNFFLTDLMSTGDCRSYEKFLSDHTLPNQHNEYCGMFYALHLYELDSYDRKFAIIDRKLNSKITGHEYKKELARRVELLHSQGFHFILATPWESKENISNSVSYPERLERYSTIDWTGGVDWFWSYMYHKHKGQKFEIDHSDKKFHYLYLNKQPRTHRKKLYDKLVAKNVLSNSLYTFINYDQPRRLPTEYELPWVDTSNYPQYGYDQDLYTKPYNHSSCSIVSETNDNPNEVFMTEKIWKPIIAQQVFIVHGNYLYLQKLREMGFKTFNNYFDESYDLEVDADKKINKLVALCDKLKSLDWQDLYLQSQALRQHNFNTFFDKEKLSAEVNKTLGSFFEFADSSKISS